MTTKKRYALPKRVWIVMRASGVDMSTSWHATKRGALLEKRAFEAEDGGRDKKHPWIVVPFVNPRL